MLSEEVEKKYRDVQTVIEDALENTDAVNLTGEEENIELTEIRNTLNALNLEFKDEIEKLENSSEWDKFCIAFFGETNAGKSTIIESLRIIYDEETRRTEAMEKKNAYHQLMLKHCEDYQNLITSLKSVNVALKNKYAKNNNWVLYIIFGIVGIVIGIVLANLGIRI